MISFNDISKTFKVAKRQPRIKAAFKSIARRDYIYIEALKNVSYGLPSAE